MKKIGLLSDTHSYFDEKIYDYFSEVDEIWHAGDIGAVEIVINPDLNTKSCMNCLPEFPLVVLQSEIL